MDYKAEVMANKTIIHSSIYRGYSHPNQVVKNIIRKYKGKYEYYTVFIMNKFGEIWSYGVEKTASGYKAWQLANDMVAKREVIMVFGGNMTIAELMVVGT